MGHVRDLPKNPKKKGKTKKEAGQFIGGVDTKAGFAVEYETLPTRKKVLDELKAAAKDAEAVYLAADPDREGEAICWHLSEALGGGRLEEEVPPRGLQRDHQARHRRGLQEPRRRGREEGGRPADAAHPRPPRRLRREPAAVGQGPPRPLRRARAVGGPEAHLRPRAGDQGLRGRGVLVGARPPGGEDAARRPRLAGQEGRQERRDRERGAGGRGARRPREGGVRRPEGAAPGAPAQSRPALHHLQAAAGGLQEAPLRRQEDDAGRAAAVRGRGGRPRRQRRPHHLHAHGLHARLRRRAGRGARPHRVHLRGGVPPREAELLQEQEGRPGRARGHPAHVFRARPGVDQAVPVQGRARPLQAHLEPLRGLADEARGVRRDRGGDRRPARTCCAPRARS